MKPVWIEAVNNNGVAHSTEDKLDLRLAAQMVAAAQGDTSAYFNLGVAYSTGSDGADCDLIEAHKWFNLAAVAGHEEAQMCRADISEEMTARARQWIAEERRKAA
jgi:uncharacterized protein